MPGYKAHYKTSNKFRKGKNQLLPLKYLVMADPVIHFNLTLQAKLTEYKAQHNTSNKSACT